MGNKQKYQFEVLTAVLKPALFRSFIQDLQNSLNPKDHLDISFGWDPNLADDKQVADQKIPASLLTITLNRIIDSGFTFGRTDIRISTKGFEFKFCNDRDLHFRSNNRETIESMVKIWKTKGFTVYENGVPL